MKSYKFTPKKNTAQAMVEFAIVLPILLLLLYGLLEAGRLLFIYSSIVTASRQAVRYGAATGDGINPGIPRYLDCAGIRVAANRADFLNAFDEYDVNIQWDSGPTTTVNTICTNSPGNPPDRSLPLPASENPANFSPDGTTNRLIVTINGRFNILVPLTVRGLRDRVITATSARTILASVSIGMPQAPAPLLLTITPNPTTYLNVGDVITYTYNVTNGPVAVTGLIIIDDKVTGITCVDTALAANASTTCTGTYTITATDISAGSVTNTAHAEASDGVNTISSSNVTATVTLLPPASLGLSLTPNRSTYLRVGNLITYTYNVTNGPVPLTGLTVIDNKATGITCGATALAANASTTCTGTYSIIQADIDAGSVVNIAHAEALDGSQTVSSSDATATITFLPQPSLRLDKTASVVSATAGDTIQYTFTLTNTGNVPLTAATVSDPRLGGTVQNCGGDLALDASIACTQSYVVTPPDVTAGTIINTASATAQYAGQPYSASSGEVTVYTPAVFSTVTTDTSSVDHIGQVITYTYTIYNNTSSIQYFSPYSITNNLSNGGTVTVNCSGATSPLAPRTSTTCSGTYTVTQSDLDNGAVIDNTNIKVTACTSATNCNSQQNKVTSNTIPSVSVTVVTHPALSLQVTASPNPAMTLGQQITYTYRLTNTGDVTLKQPFTVTDAKLGAITCSTTDLLRGANKTCTKTYIVTQADIDAGSTTNGTATASAAFNNQTVSASAPPVTVTTFEGARLKLQITPNPTTYSETAQVILYIYTLTNTGTVPLNGPYVVTDDRVAPVDCSTAASPLAEGSSTTCVGSANASGLPGTKIVNSASASTSDGTQSNTATATVSNPVAACNSITATSLPISGATMSITINNPNNYPVTISSIEVTWNHDEGRQQGANRQPLNLSNAKWATAASPFWTAPGTVNAPSYTITPSTQTISATSSPTLVFTFADDYANKDGTEKIKINLSTAGCENTPIQSPPFP